MSLSHILWEEHPNVSWALHRAVLFGMIVTWSRCQKNGTRPQEPDFVAGLVLESSRFLCRELEDLLGRHGIQTSMLAVYCHQTPKVAYSSMTGSSCELGDLLIAHVHTSAENHVRRNALLYQAKVSSVQPYRVPASDYDQLRLYVEWPDFEYYRSPPLTGQRRSVTPKMLHTGAQYMLIDDRPPDDPRSGLTGVPGTYPIGSCMPDVWLHAHNPLEAELWDLLILRSGRPFAERRIASSGDDWSKVVWDLIDSGVRKTFNRKRSGRHGSRRAAGDVRTFDGLSFLESASMAHSVVADVIGQPQADWLMGSDNPPSGPGEHLDYETGPEPESGISVILLETKARG